MNIKIFDKRQTNIAKGFAILLLLWHHLFMDSPERYFNFKSLLFVNNVPVECIIARYCKVCVAVFLFLSGFGLYKSWLRNSETVHRQETKRRVISYLVFIKNHLLKLLLNFWFIYLIFVPLGIFFGKKFWAYYGINPINMFVDWMGLANLFKTPTMNAAWWFMSLIILLYVLFPIMTIVLKWSPETLVVLAVMLMLFSNLFSPVLEHFFIWFPPFVLGMYFAHQELFEKLYLDNSNLSKQLVLSVLLIISGVFIRMIIEQSLAFDAVFAFSIVLFSYFILSRIPFVNVWLESLGKHSGSIFMFHTFIYSYYFHNLIYWFKYPPIILIVLTIVCFSIAMGIEYLKKLVRYDKLIVKVTS